MHVGLVLLGQMSTSFYSMFLLTASVNVVDVVNVIAGHVLWTLENIQITLSHFVVL